MALFVLGAGATRGCKFVNPARKACLPPLNSDFYTQLQKVRNPKHKGLIARVMKDVVELFGTNFDVTMEAVFSTLEHTIRMLQTTGENRAFKSDTLKQKRDRLQQAIAAVLEESLTGQDDGGSSERISSPCEYHNRFVKDILKPRDDMISFNYDCTVDYALKRYGIGKWNSRYGYGFTLGSRGSLLSGDEFWQPDLRPASKERTVHLYKLHGSLHFYITQRASSSLVRLKERPYTKQHGDLRFSIIPPETHKAYDRGAFAKLWKEAAAAIHKAKHVVVLGYSMSPNDLHATALFQTSLRPGGLKSLVVVNPDQHARRRIRSVLQRGLDARSIVLSFERFEHFLAASREIWGV